MSRLANKPIQIPSSVTVTAKDGSIRAQGPKGELSYQFHDVVGVAVESSEIRVTRRDDSKTQRAMQGTVYSRIKGLIEGVENGFTKTLDLIGVGYRVVKKGEAVELAIGFSHPVLFHPPQGVVVEVEKNTIRVTGIDKQLVGEVAANIRKLKKPEPYKGKGIRYTTETVRRKAGKAGKAGA